MTDELCIYWEYEGGKGYSSARPSSEIEILETWRDALKKSYPDGVFSVLPKPPTNIIRTTRDLVRELI